MDHKTYDNFELINTTGRLTPQRLWKILNNHFDDNQEFSNNFNKRKAWEKRYYNLDWKGPYPKLFVSYLRSNNILRITIYFFEEKELFNKAVRLKNELEKTLNCKLVIDDSTEKTQNIYYERNDIDPYGDEQYLANLVKWIQDTALEFKKAIYKHIHSSQPSEVMRIRSNATSKVSDFKPIPDNSIDELDYQLKIGDEMVSEVEAESYVPNPEPRKQTIRVSEGEKYPRDPRQAKIALIRANNKCEHVEEHWTFIRKTDSLPYTEPHHLIPISQYKRFDIDLDVPANIVSLCSNCHNCVHYGLEYERNEILSKLYDKKKAELEQAGIDISLDDLKAMYE